MTKQNKAPQKVRALMESIYQSLTDPTFTKADILRVIKTNVSCDMDDILEEFFGKITEEMIEEVEEANVDEEDAAETKIVSNGIEFETLDVVKLSAAQKRSFTEIPTIQEARFLTDIYYQTQSKRIVLQNQLRALKQGFDSETEDSNGTKNRSFLEWYLYNTETMENEIKKALAIFSDSNYIARWAKSVKGIGPTIATCLSANLKLIEDEHGSCTMSAGNWWSYCGLNDNRRPWIGAKKSQKLVEELLKEHDGVLDNQFVFDLSERTGWRMSHYEKMALRDDGTWDKQKLISATAMIPYNKDMKVLCYKIGHSFMLNKNKDDSLYGKILKEREEVENYRNNRGDYADQAAKALSEKNYKKGTIAYKHYSQGKLPPAHIAARCRRYATKLFISHLFEAAYYNRYGKQAPNPYVLQYLGHKDYIPPEVAYDAVERDDVEA